MYQPVYRPYTEGTQKRGRTKVKGKYFDAGLNKKGTPVNDWWPDVKKITSPTDPEKTGWPTQKSLELYGRIITVSSNKGDVVLDPFAGCATTCVAAEQLQRQWVGIDLWDKASEVVEDRMANEVGLFGRVNAVDEVPQRTDEGETGAPFLRVKVRVKEPSGPRWSRREMYEYLLGQHGAKCQGCDRTFDDPRYLELDHNTPRSDGGINHISNRILLCGPCNRLKSNTYTLTGLRRQNKKLGHMANSGVENPTLKRIREERTRQPGLFE
ncbi:MAG: DNA methyltransferase [Gammaproteobacteria bacterium]|nr:DNA methyltransferase [Gammaproteobacteria bacterium]